MNNLLLWTTNFSPEKTGIGKYNGEMIEYFNEKKINTIVITTHPHYPEWHFKDYNNLLYKISKISDEKTIIRVPSIIIGKSGSLLSRLSLELSFTFFSTPIIMCLFLFYTKKIMTIEPGIIQTLLISILSKFFNLRTWLHIQDLQLPMSIELGFLPKYFKNILEKINSKTYNSYSIVSTISDSMRLKIQKIRNRDIYLFPNWVDTETYKLFKSDSQSKKKFGLPLNKKILLYSGSIGRKQSLMKMIDLAKNLSHNKEFIFVICGSGPMLKHIKQQSREYNLNNVIFRDFIEEQDFPNFLNQADIHLVFQDDKVADLVFPSKVSSILACGGCMISTTSESSELGKILDKEKIGLRVNPDDLKEIEKQIFIILENQELRSSIKSKARDYAIKNYNKKIILELMVKTLRNELLLSVTESQIDRHHKTIQ